MEPECLERDGTCEFRRRWDGSPPSGLARLSCFSWKLHRVKAMQSRLTVLVSMPKSMSIITPSLETSRVTSMLQLDGFADLAVKVPAPGSLFRASMLLIRRPVSSLSILVSGCPSAGFQDASKAIDLIERSRPSTCLPPPRLYARLTGLPRSTLFGPV